MGITWIVGYLDGDYQQKNQAIIRSLEFSAPSLTPPFPEKAEGLDMQLVIIVPKEEASLKPQ